MAKAKISKYDAILDYVAAHPQATNEQIAKKFKTTKGYVATIKYRDRMRDRMLTHSTTPPKKIRVYK